MQEPFHIILLMKKFAENVVVTERAVEKMNPGKNA